MEEVNKGSLNSWDEINKLKNEISIMEFESLNEKYPPWNQYLVRENTTWDHIKKIEKKQEKIDKQLKAPIFGLAIRN
jgi:hypothetical protein